MYTFLMQFKLANGIFNDTLESLYPGHFWEARLRYSKAIKAFEELYGEQDVHIFSAAGRTEVGGNHTDHQKGRVLAASVDLDTIAVAAKREDRIVRLKSEGYDPIELDLDDLTPNPDEYGTTRALIRGVAAGLKKRSRGIGGFDAYVTGNVPAGSGLSSSASFEVLIGAVISGLYGRKELSPVTNAIIGQEAENQFFGKPCGLMDQVACANGGLVHIDFKPRSPVITPVGADFKQFHHTLCITNTGGSHADLTDAYAAIPEEMKAVAKALDGKLLSDVPEKKFLAAIPRLRGKVGDRAILRAMHWYEECRRADGERAALEAGDFDAFLQLVRASGRSSYELLQNISSGDPREQGIALALAVSERVLGDRGACRVHGGGFAGTIQAFVPEELTDAYKEELDRIFGEDACRILHIRPQPCGKVI